MRSLENEDYPRKGSSASLASIMLPLGKFTLQKHKEPINMVKSTPDGVHQCIEFCSPVCGDSPMKFLLCELAELYT